MEQIPFRCNVGTLNGTLPAVGQPLTERYAVIWVRPLLTPGELTDGADEFTVVVRHLWSGALMQKVFSVDGDAAVEVRLRPPAVTMDDSVKRIYDSPFWMFELALFRGRLKESSPLAQVGSTALTPLSAVQNLIGGNAQLFDSWPRPVEWPIPPGMK